VAIAWIQMMVRVQYNYRIWKNTNCPDLNSDGIVNIMDLISVAVSFGTSRGEAGYNVAVDCNGDGVIDLMDLIAVATKFGQVLPN